MITILNTNMFIIINNDGNVDEYICCDYRVVK